MLVAVLGLGVLGAALATILSQGVSAVLVLVSLTRAETVYLSLIHISGLCPVEGKRQQLIAVWRSIHCLKTEFFCKGLV